MPLGSSCKLSSCLVTAFDDYLFRPPGVLIVFMSFVSSISPSRSKVAKFLCGTFSDFWRILCTYESKLLCVSSIDKFSSWLLSKKAVSASEWWCPKLELLRLNISGRATRWTVSSKDSCSAYRFVNGGDFRSLVSIYLVGDYTNDEAILSRLVSWSMLSRFRRSKRWLGARSRFITSTCLPGVSYSSTMSSRSQSLSESEAVPRGPLSSTWTSALASSGATSY